MVYPFYFQAAQKKKKKWDKAQILGLEIYSIENPDKYKNSQFSGLSSP